MVDLGRKCGFARSDGLAVAADGAMVAAHDGFDQSNLQHMARLRSQKDLRHRAPLAAYTAWKDLMRRAPRSARV